MASSAGPHPLSVCAEKANKAVQPVFISIDPERDNTNQVKKYVKEFHPNLLGLTGSVEQVSTLAFDVQGAMVICIVDSAPVWGATHKTLCLFQVKNAAKAYRVYFTKTDDTQDYLVDHSIIMYLIDPKGSFVSFYGKNYTAEQLATAVGNQIDNWKSG